MNECSKSAICGVGGQCVNLLGSYKCECHSGFRSKSQRHPACEGTNTLIVMTLLTSVLGLSPHCVYVTIICLHVWDYLW